MIYLNISVLMNLILYKYSTIETVREEIRLTLTFYAFSNLNENTISSHQKFFFPYILIINEKVINICSCHSQARILLFVVKCNNNFSFTEFALCK